jgi:hypothetical protein
MARFNLDEYELVETRIARFLDDYPDGRIVTEEMTRTDDRAKGYWVIRAAIYTDHEDQHSHCPKATGWAFEIEGTAGANATSALENCETSAIGRALANAGYHSKKRPSQEEMKKVARADNPIDPQFVERVNQAETVDQLTELWEQAVAQGWSDNLMKIFTARKGVLTGGK